MYYWGETVVLIRQQYQSILYFDPFFSLIKLISFPFICFQGEYIMLTLGICQVWSSWVWGESSGPGLLYAKCWHWQLRWNTSIWKLNSLGTMRLFNPFQRLILLNSSTVIKSWESLIFMEPCLQLYARRTVWNM